MLKNILQYPYIKVGRLKMNVASISLNYSLKKGFWEIKTAEPRRCSTIQKRALIWTAAKHTVSGNGDRLN